MSNKVASMYQQSWGTQYPTTCEQLAGTHLHLCIKRGTVWFKYTQEYKTVTLLCFNPESSLPTFGCRGVKRVKLGYTEAYQVTLKCIKYNSISISLFSPIGISFFKYYNSPINLLLTVSIFKQLINII